MSGVIKTKDLLGFHTAQTIKDVGFTMETTPESFAKFCNGVKIVGYIPVGGIAAGITHCYAAAKEEKLKLSGRILLFVRGILEILGFGVLFLLPDLVASGRHISCLSLDLNLF